MRVNLGSGGRPVQEPGWINVDIDPNANSIDMIVDAGVSLPFLAESLDEVRAHDVLEHFSYHIASQVLQRWIAALKPGGWIEIRVPALDEITTAFAERRLDLLRTVQLLYGGQSTPYDYHYTAINFGWLLGQLHWYGCEEIVQVPDWYEYALLVRARKQLVVTRGWVERDFRGRAVKEA